jgi:hypothetical protein
MTADIHLLANPLARPGLSPRSPHFSSQLDESQGEPLLHSSGDATSPDQQSSLVEDEEGNRKEKPLKLPYLHISLDYVKRVTTLLVIGLLLLLAVVAYNRNPEPLINSPLHQGERPEITSPSPENTIDYSSYISFPLTPLQYAAECWKLHQGLVQHMGYWVVPEKGIMDVSHKSFSRTCNSTITYQLDQYSGLFAQLALLAQVAALAREVSDSLTNCQFDTSTISSARKDSIH